LVVMVQSVMMVSGDDGGDNGEWDGVDSQW
jgi:hypothetical protein